MGSEWRPGVGGATKHVKETLMESRPGMRVEWRLGRDRGMRRERGRKSRSKWTLKWIFFFSMKNAGTSAVKPHGP